MQLPRQFSAESEENPLVLSITILQDQLNIKMRTLQTYAALLQELEDFGLQLAHAKADILALYTEEHEKYMSQLGRMKRDITQSAEQQAQARTYIERLDAERKAIVNQQSVLRYEKEKSLIELEVLCKETLQVLLADIEAVDAASTPALLARKQRDKEIMVTLTAYLQFLKDRTVAEKAKLKVATERVESLAKRVAAGSQIEEIDRNIAQLRETKTIPEREVANLKQVLADLKLEEDKEKRGIAAARTQISMLEQKIKSETAKASTLTKSIDTNSAKAEKLAAECKKLEFTRNELRVKLPELEQRKKAINESADEVNSTWIKAEQYVSDVLTPIQERNTAELFKLQFQQNSGISTAKTQLKELEEKHSRLTIKQFSAAPTFASTPLRSLTQTPSPSLPVLTAARGRLEADCARLDEQIQARNKAIVSRRGAMPISQPESHMTWTVLASFAATFLVLTWGQ
jgi:chromosome segregation ATPase